MKLPNPFFLTKETAVNGRTSGYAKGNPWVFKKGHPYAKMPGRTYSFKKGPHTDPRCCRKGKRPPEHTCPKGVKPKHLMFYSIQKGETLWTTGRLIPSIGYPNFKKKDIKMIEEKLPGAFSFTREEAVRIKDAIFEAAMNKNEYAIRIVADKVLKKTTHFSSTIDERNLLTLEDVTQAMNRIINMAHAGTICHEDFTELSKAYETHFRMLKEKKVDGYDEITDKLEARVAELKNVKV